MPKRLMQSGLRSIGGGNCGQNLSGLLRLGRMHQQPDPTIAKQQMRLHAAGVIRLDNGLEAAAFQQGLVQFGLISSEVGPQADMARYHLFIT